MSKFSVGATVMVTKIDSYDRSRLIRIGDIGTIETDSTFPMVLLKKIGRCCLHEKQLKIYASTNLPKPQPAFSKELRRHFKELQYTAEWDEKLYKRVFRLHLKFGGTK